jgi:hypothetical protein
VRDVVHQDVLDEPDGAATPGFGDFRLRVELSDHSTEDLSIIRGVWRVYRTPKGTLGAKSEHVDEMLGESAAAGARGHDLNHIRRTGGLASAEVGYQIVKGVFEKLVGFGVPTPEFDFPPATNRGAGREG